MFQVHEWAGLRASALRELGLRVGILLPLFLINHVILRPLRISKGETPNQSFQSRSRELRGSDSRRTDRFGIASRHGHRLAE
jgi:hypothetical protein